MYPLANCLLVQLDLVVALGTEKGFTWQVLAEVRLVGDSGRDLILGEIGTSDTLRQLTDELVLLANHFAADTVAPLRDMALVTNGGAVIALAHNVARVLWNCWLGATFVPVQEGFLSGESVLIFRVRVREDNLALLVIGGNDLVLARLGPLIKLDQVGGGDGLVLSVRAQREQ